METLYLLLLSLFGSVIALTGGVVFLFNRKLSNLLERHSVPFAAGVLVTVSILGLIPESEHALGEPAFLIVLLSFLGIYLFEHIFFGIHHHDGEGHDEIKSTSIGLVIIGDTIHNFIDGVAIAASFMVSPGLGFVTALSTFLHEIPHEIGDFGILLKAGWSKSKILIVNILSALMTVVGAFTIYFINDDSNLIGSLMAVSAGVFLYLGASDFLPKVKDEMRGNNKLVSLLPLILGALIMIITLLLVPHEH